MRSPEMRESSWIGKGSSISRLSDPRPQRPLAHEDRVAHRALTRGVARAVRELAVDHERVDPPPSKLRPWYTPIDTRKSPSSVKDMPSLVSCRPSTATRKIVALSRENPIADRDGGRMKLGNVPSIESDEPTTLHPRARRAASADDAVETAAVARSDA